MSASSSRVESRKDTVGDEKENLPAINFRKRRPKKRAYRELRIIRPAFLRILGF